MHIFLAQPTPAYGTLSSNYQTSVFRSLLLLITDLQTQKPATIAEIPTDGKGFQGPYRSRAYFYP